MAVDAVLRLKKSSNLDAIQIIKVEPVAAKDCRRPLIKQMHDAKIRFPLPSKVQKSEGSIFKANRPNTYFL